MTTLYAWPFHMADLQSFPGSKQYMLCISFFLMGFRLWRNVHGVMIRWLTIGITTWHLLSNWVMLEVMMQLNGQSETCYSVAVGSAQHIWVSKFRMPAKSTIPPKYIRKTSQNAYFWLLNCFAGVLRIWHKNAYEIRKMRSGWQVWLWTDNPWRLFQRHLLHWKCVWKEFHWNILYGLSEVGIGSRNGLAPIWCGFGAEPFFRGRLTKTYDTNMRHSVSMS